MKGPTMSLLLSQVHGIITYPSRLPLLSLPSSVSVSAISFQGTNLVPSLFNTLCFVGYSPFLCTQNPIIDPTKFLPTGFFQGPSGLLRVIFTSTGSFESSFKINFGLLTQVCASELLVNSLSFKWQPPLFNAVHFPDITMFVFSARGCISIGLLLNTIKVAVIFSYLLM